MVCSTNKNAVSYFTHDGLVFFLEGLVIVGDVVVAFKEGIGILCNDIPDILTFSYP